VKYTHGPGRSAVGGVPALGAHGKLPLTTNARAEVAENTKVMAVVMSNSRRRTPRLERGEAGIPSPTLSAPGVVFRILLALNEISFATIVLPLDREHEIPRWRCVKQKDSTVGTVLKSRVFNLHFRSRDSGGHGSFGVRCGNLPKELERELIAYCKAHPRKSNHRSGGLVAQAREIYGD
jgi:hypothetical protein